MKKITLKKWGNAAVLFGAMFLTTLDSNAQCLTAAFGLYPDATLTPSTCDGLFENIATEVGYASEYSNVDVVLGQTYIFKSSIASDFITIGNVDGGVAWASGTGSVTWVATETGTVRFYTHLDAACGQDDTAFRVRSVICGTVTTEQPDYINLQWPQTQTITAGGLFTVYGQVYEAGLTDVVPNIDGQAPGIQAWVGISPIGDNSNPNTWTTWIPAAHNTFSVGNNDEYMVTLGADLAPGTYYYATRFRLGNGPYVYGGYTNFWDAATAPSGVLTVTAALNDNFANAETVICGDTYYGNTAFVTLDENSAPDGGGADMDAPNLWYKFTGGGSPQNVTLALCNSSYDTSVLVYTGTSGALTFVAANDDACGVGGTQSLVNFTSDGVTTYYIAVEGYNVASTGAFVMDVDCGGVNPPAVANQTCALALNVPVDGTDNSSDNSFGDVTATQPTCDTFGSIQDVWFSFVAPASGTVDCLVTNGTMTSSNFNVYSGVCASLTAVANTCNSNLTTPTTESLTGLTAGGTYYVQVWSSALEQGTFTLRLSDPSLGLNNFNSSNFSYYPNPVKNVLNLSYTKDISNVAVYNLIGQQVLAKSINSNESQVDMSDLANGTYLVKVTADGQVKTIKVIKE